MFSSYGFYGLHANNCGTYLYHFWQHKKILKANDLPTDLNVHSLRYTAASLFIASGTDVGTVAGLPGHSQPMTALDIYTTPLIRTRKRTVRSCRAAWKSEHQKSPMHGLELCVGDSLDGACDLKQLAD